MNKEKIALIIAEKKKNNEKVVLDLGCGLNKLKGSIGVDSFEAPGVDIFHDLETGLGFIADNSIDEVNSRHFLEHIDNFELMMKEIHRVLKNGGKNIATVPHFSNPYYYSDYTHKRFFGLYSFDYFATENSQLKRKSPLFYNDCKFEIESRYINFSSSFFVRNIVKQVYKRIVNINNYTKEYYEEMFTGFIHAYELKFVMIAKK